MAYPFFLPWLPIQTRVILYINREKMQIHLLRLLLLQLAYSCFLSLSLIGTCFIAFSGYCLSHPVYLFLAHFAIRGNVMRQFIESNDRLRFIRFDLLCLLGAQGMLH